MTPEIAAALRAPFTDAQVGRLPKVTCKACSNGSCEDHKKKVCGTCHAWVGKHIHIDFVGHAHVRERLLDVDPEWNWEPMGLSQDGLPLLDEYGGLWIKLTVGGTTRLGYGDADGKRGSMATKVAIGDAIRNAGQSFGIALEMWLHEPPTPVAAEQPAPQQRQRKLDANQLRGALREMYRKTGKSVDALTADFFEWSHGTEILKADADVLTEFKAHLEKPAEAGAA